MKYLIDFLKLGLDFFKEVGREIIVFFRSLGKVAAYVSGHLPLLIAAGLVIFFGWFLLSISKNEAN